MNINPITTSTETNFKGKLSLKGKWSSALTDGFTSNAYINKALENHSLTARMKVTHNQFLGERYKLVLSVKKDNPTFLERVKYTLGLNPKANLSKHYHSDRGTDALIRERLKNTLSDQLKIQL